MLGRLLLFGFPWLLLSVCLLLALFESPRWWIPAIGLGLQRALAGRVAWHCHHRSWWKIHDGALNAYSGAVAHKSAEAEQEGHIFDANRVDDINDAIALMIKQIKPHWDHRRIGDFVLQQFLERRPNVEPVANLVLAARPKASESDKQELRRLVEEGFEEPSASLKVRMAIAGVIEDELGAEERADYLYQTFLGNV